MTDTVLMGAEQRLLDLSDDYRLVCEKMKGARDGRAVSRYSRDKRRISMEMRQLEQAIEASSQNHATINGVPKRNKYDDLQEFTNGP